METANEKLFSYGVAGIILAIILTVFIWAFKRLFDGMVDDRKDFKVFMTEQVKAITDLRMEMHQSAAAQTKEVVEKLQAQHDKVISSVYDAASNVINEVKDNSRPVHLEPAKRTT